jgi:KDO2-lipid IV(A) lauroyltransferase
LSSVTPDNSVASPPAIPTHPGPAPNRPLWLVVLDVLVAIPVLAAVAPVYFAPRGAARRMARFYAFWVYLLWGAGRRTAMINLRRAYGSEMTYDKARVWTRQVVANLAVAIVDAVHFQRRFQAHGPRWENLYEAEDPDLERRILSDPRPKILAGGHLGSWEVAMMMAGRRGGKNSAFVARRIENVLLQRLVRWGRLRSTAQWIEKLGGVAKALERLQQGRSVALLIDENGGRSGPFLDFFGRPASTRKTAALLSVMTGSPVVLGAAVRRPGSDRYLYRLAYFEPASYGNHADAARRMTEDLLRTWEAWVRDDPQQWRWVHWRWKTRPDGADETYSRRDLRACYGLTLRC